MPPRSAIQPRQEFAERFIRYILHINPDAAGLIRTGERADMFHLLPLRRLNTAQSAVRDINIIGVYNLDDNKISAFISAAKRSHDRT